MAETQAAASAALERLGNLHVLILDTDIRAAQMTRTVLSTLGINKTMLTRDAAEAVSMVADKPVDVLVTEWDTKPKDGIELAVFLRTSPRSPSPMLPIILATQRQQPDELILAINSGINEIVAKPFSPKAMADRLFSIIDDPRSFIISPGFTGPDRRRAPPPPGVLERRGQREQPLIITREQMAEGLASDGRPRMVLPDFSLKKKIETVPANMAGIESILSPAQAAKQEGDYVQWALNDVAAMRQSLKSLLASPEYSVTYIERITTASISVRARAMTSGYILAAKVAAHLNDFCRKRFQKDNKQHCLVIEKHIEALLAIFQARLIGDGGALGQELFDELERMVKKYA